MFRPKILAALLSLTLASGFAIESPAAAARSCGGNIKSGVDSGRLVSLERVISIINSRHPGELLNACLDSSNSAKPVYRVAWLSKGRKMNIVVNARTGRILSS